MKIFILSFLTLCPLLLSGCLEKKTQTIDDAIPTIEISDSFAFATMPGASTGAAFMTLHNTGSENDVLLGIKSDIAKITEIHQNMIDPDDQTMMMRKVPSIEIASGDSVILEPTGYHVMFIQLKEPLTIDLTIPVTLLFEKAGEKKVDIQVVPPGSTPMSQSHHEHH